MKLFCSEWCETVKANFGTMAFANILLWKTGPRAGCYAPLQQITSFSVTWHPQEAPSHFHRRH